jgi:hypothetical protein
MLAVALACVPAFAQQGPKGAAPSFVAPPGPKYAPDRVLVRFLPGLAAEARASTHAQLGAQVQRRYRSIPGLELVKLPNGLRVREAIRVYRNNPNVLYAEPDYMVHALETTPNDTSFSELWAMKNTGLVGGTVDADIDATDAWDLSTGSSSVVVGVIDSGVYYNHADLVDNIYNNTAECSGTPGVDDDGNGYVDDCHGIDTANNDSDPLDDENHGTHVSGTIGARGNNARGVAGVNWQVKILACKFLTASGSGATSDAIDCLDYLAVMKDRGVNIVATNNSWGGGSFSQALLDAIHAHLDRGILFVAAAGNDGLDNDSSASFPSNHYLPNVISVAATTRTDALASYSDRGRHTVHLAAPGSEILSTIAGIGDAYRTASGTSMAAPHVTGAAALLKAQNPALNWIAIKNRILAGGDTKDSLADTIARRRLNVFGAMTCSNQVVQTRLRPAGNIVGTALGTHLALAMLNINCGAPNGSTSVRVSETGETISLLDNGIAPDQVAGDGIYSGQWTPPDIGDYTLLFDNDDVLVTVHVLLPYTSSPTTFAYRNIAGTSLDLGDDFSGVIWPPFPIQFGGRSFDFAYVSSNGTINFDAFFSNYLNQALPYSGASTLVAPWWDDLSPRPGTAQNVFWEVTGSQPNRELVIEWRDAPHYQDPLVLSESVKFQVVLSENKSDVLFNYADTIFGGSSSLADQGASATVGVQVGTSEANQFSFNTPSLSNNSALLWQAAVPVVPVAPTAVSVTPSSGSGTTQTFSLLYWDANGADKITYVQALINGSLSWYRACAVLYLQSSNRLYLVLDSGAGWQGPLTPGQAGTVSNSQCTLDGGGSSVSAVGNNLTVNAALTFKPAFAGNKTVYLDAEDTPNSLSSGFQTLGTWTVPTLGPTAVSVTPNSGSGASQTFSFLFSDASGASKITYVQALINGSLAWYHACAVLYYQSTNKLYLVQDSGAGWQGPLTPGQAGTLQNSQCTLNAGASSVSTVGNNLTVNAALTFKPAFTGNKTVYLDAEDTPGKLSSGFKTLGSWTVPNFAPTAVSVTPSSGTGSTQIFSFLFSDTGGANKITYVQALINGSLAWYHSCAVLYYQSTNRLYLVLDSGTGWQGPLTPGQVGTLQNGQCTLNGAGSSVSAVGNNLTVNAALTFKPGFGGTKTVYLDAEDTASHLSSGWQNRGTWTVPSVPTAVSVTPSSGSGASQTFSFLFSDAGGASKITYIQALINGSLAWQNSCAVLYYQSTNRLYLVLDSGTGWQGPLTPGQAGTLANTQCTLDGGGSSVSAVGNNLTVNAALSFKPAFTGSKIVFLDAEDTANHLSSGWQTLGSWTVP